jgi:hypothetical protein
MRVMPFRPTPIGNDKKTNPSFKSGKLPVAKAREHFVPQVTNKNSAYGIGKIIDYVF